MRFALSLEAFAETDRGDANGDPTELIGDSDDAAIVSQGPRNTSFLNYNLLL